MASGNRDVIARIDALLPNKTITEFQQFLQLFDLISQHIGHDWLFRGVDDETRELIPKVGRPERKIKFVAGTGALPMPYALRDEYLALETFQREAPLFLSRVPASEIEWLAVARHYGVPTRLLDWSESFAIATWFAVRQPLQMRIDPKNPQKKPVPIRPAVWIVRNQPEIEKKYRDDAFALPSVRIYRPSRIDGRIRNQQAVFTVHPDPTKAWLPTESRKIAIDPRLCFLLGKRLHSLGINELQMFPDLVGLGSHVAWLYQNNWLVGKSGSTKPGKR